MSLQGKQQETIKDKLNIPRTYRLGLVQGQDSFPKGNKTENSFSMYNNFTF